TQFLPFAHFSASVSVDADVAVVMCPLLCSSLRVSSRTFTSSLPTYAASQRKRRHPCVAVPTVHPFQARDFRVFGSGPHYSMFLCKVIARRRLERQAEREIRPS